MKKDFTRLIVPIFYVFLGLTLLILISCGGGGSDSTTSTPTATVLEGKWISSSDNHPTGSACGLDSHGGYGERQTLTFTNNQYNYKYEGCLIISGNTGAYIETKNITGAFTIVDLHRNSAPLVFLMTAIDFAADTIGYTSFNITGDNLRIGTATPTADGSTPDKRASQVDIDGPVYIKQTTPAVNKSQDGGVVNEGNAEVP